MSWELSDKLGKLETAPRQAQGLPCTRRTRRCCSPAGIALHPPPEALTHTCRQLTVLSSCNPNAHLQAYIRA
eukprot:1156805-Pelagomonas_calceolata.AAC.6